MNLMEKLFKPNLETFCTDLKFCDDFLGKTCFIGQFSNDPFALRKTTYVLELKDIYLDHIVYRKQRYDLTESYIGNDIYTKLK